MTLLKLQLVCFALQYLVDPKPLAIYPEEALSKPQSEGGNETGPDMHWLAHSCSGGFNEY